MWKDLPEEQRQEYKKNDFGFCQPFQDVYTKRGQQK